MGKVQEGGESKAKSPRSREKQPEYEEIYGMLMSRRENDIRAQALPSATSSNQKKELAELRKDVRHHRAFLTTL